MNEVKKIALSEYEQVPPENVWLGLCSALDSIEASEKRFQDVREHEILPEPDVWAAINKALTVDSLPNVEVADTPKQQSQQQKPPISIDQSKGNKKSVLFRSKSFIYASIAATLITGLITIYRLTNTDNFPHENIATTLPKPSIPHSNPPSKVLPIDSTPIAVEPKKSPAPVKEHRPKNLSTEPAVANAFVSNHIFEIEDEDSFFLTLANYILPENNKGNNKPSIKVDQHSSVYISPKLSLFMQWLYEKSDRKNKPTRRARKSYRALRSWKKASNKSFGSANMQNLSDPFVLTEFLYKNRKL